MIKIKKEKIFLTFAIFSILFYGYYVKKNSNDASCFLKEFFLYTGSNIKISFNSILLYYTIHILVLFSFLPSSFLYSRNYRGLILHRYGKKTFFLKQALLKNLFNILLTMLWVSVPLITFLYVNNIYIKYSSIISAFLLFINIVLYYNICILFKFQFNMRYNDVYSTMIVVFFTIILIFFDLNISYFCIITYGEIYKLIIGLLIQIIVYISNLIYLTFNITRTDLL